MADNKIISICGSMRYYDSMLAVASQLTSKGYIILFPFKSEKLNGELCTVMDHHKIDVSDEVFVVNPGGYFGRDTAYNIRYAASKDKPVSFMTETLDTKRLHQTLCKHFDKKVDFNRNPILGEIRSEYFKEGNKI